MDDQRAQLVLDGDISPLKQKFREAGNDLKRFGEEGEKTFSRMTGPLEKLQSKFIAIGAILAGGAVFKEAVAQAAEFSEESIKMGRALGISATEASLLKEALDANNTSQDEFIGAAQKLSKQVRENEGELNKMGLATRDAHGNLRPLNELTIDAIGVLKGYKEGTDRAMAAQVLFGKGFELTSNLIEINKDSVAELTDLQRDLGAVVGAENVKAWQEFDDAGDKSSLTLKAMTLAIGNALLPVLTDLGNWFASIGPAAVTVIKGAFGGLVATFHLVTTGVTVLWETINAMVVTVAEPIRALGASISKALSGDWDGAASELKNIGSVISGAWGQAFDQMANKAQSTRDKIWNLFANPADAAAPGGEGKSATGLIKKDGGDRKEKAAALPDSYMQYYDAVLAQEKNLYEQENVLRQFSKEQELAYWRELQQNAVLTSKDSVAIAKRTAALELDIRRKSAKDAADLDAVMIDSKKSAALAQIDLELQQANFARENGEITKLQLLDLEEQFARRRFEIEYQSLLERQELAKNDPNASPAALAQIKEQMLQVERNYQLQKNQLGQNKKNEKGSFGSMFDDAGQAFGNMARNLLTSATTLRAQLAQVFQAIYQSFIVNLVTKPFGEWLASQARMMAVKMGFMAEETTAEATSAVAKSTAQHAAGITGVMSNSAIAATGAMASVAAIPFVGWAMAPEVGAATYASGMAYLASAKNGYDIPKGLNPLVQTHEEEMILPSVHANTIRRLGEIVGEGGGSADKSGGPVHFHINTMDAGGVKGFLTKNAHAMAPGLRRLGRNFSPTKV